MSQPALGGKTGLKHPLSFHLPYSAPASSFKKKTNQIISESERPLENIHFHNFWSQIRKQKSKEINMPLL